MSLTYPMDDENQLNPLDVIYRIMETDQLFYRTIRFMQSNREILMAAQLRNTAQALSLVRAYTANNRTVTYTATIPLHAPSNWDEPVVVHPTAEQISAATTITPTPVTETNCSICQDSLTEAGTRITHCGHVFHNNCIAEWFTQSVRCPLCRHDIREVGFPVPTSSETARGPLPVSSRLVSWLAGVNPTGHTEETAEFAERHV